MKQAVFKDRKTIDTYIGRQTDCCADKSTSISTL